MPAHGIEKVQYTTLESRENRNREYAVSFRDVEIPQHGTSSGNQKQARVLSVMRKGFTIAHFDIQSHIYSVMRTSI
jgi:hypothetical protein